MRASGRYSAALSIKPRQASEIISCTLDAVCEQLRKDLLALVNVVTGEPVVRRVERSDRWYGRSSTDTLPDLFIDWQRSALIETVWSPKIGLVHAPYTNWRVGIIVPTECCWCSVPASRPA